MSGLEIYLDPNLHQDVSAVVLYQYPPLGSTDMARILTSERIGSESITLPGGKRMLGETFNEAARREMVEETHVLVPLERLYLRREVKSAFNNYPIQYYSVYCHPGEFIIKNVEPDKHASWSWTDFDTISNYVTSGRLPLEVADIFWLMTVNIIRFQVENATKKEMFRSVPSHILEDCVGYADIERMYKRILILMGIKDDVNGFWRKKFESMF